MSYAFDTLMGLHGSAATSVHLHGMMPNMNINFEVLEGLILAQFNRLPGTDAAAGTYWVEPPMADLTARGGEGEECVVCMDGLATHTVVSSDPGHYPCGHLCLCYLCASKRLLKVCPLCRAPILAIVVTKS